MTVQYIRDNIFEGDEVTWNDPDEGTCTRTGILSDIEYIGGETFRIVFEDGWETEVYAEELS